MSFSSLQQHERLDESAVEPLSHVATILAQLLRDSSKRLAARFSRRNCQFSNFFRR